MIMHKYAYICGYAHVCMFVRMCAVCVDTYMYLSVCAARAVCLCAYVHACRSCVCTYAHGLICRFIHVKTNAFLWKCEFGHVCLQIYTLCVYA